MAVVAGVEVEKALAWVEAGLGRVTKVDELSGGWTSTMLALHTEDGDTAVLRLMTKEPWRTYGAALTTRESAVQHMLSTSAVSAPVSLGLDASGVHCGHPAHLMTLVPGLVELGRSDDRFLSALAEVLATIHSVVPTIEVRQYESWAWDVKFVVPSWATDPGVWQDAFDLLRSPAPEYETCFIHRDFQPYNVLWANDVITGVVDWVETSMGPAWLDVAHCSTNLALLHGTEVGNAFARSYTRLTGVAPEPYFDVMDIVGFLPPPGREGLVVDPQRLRRLEDQLRVVMSRI